MTERERQKNKDLSPVGSLPKWLQQVEWSQIEAKAQDLHPGLPHG